MTLPAFADHGRPVNGCQTQRRQIGTYHHLDSTQVFQESQEVAAWHRHGTFPAGDYPVFEYRGYGGYWVSVELSGGVVTSASFPALFGGVRISGTTDRGSEEVGNPFAYAIQLDSFGLADADPAKFTLDPAIDIRTIGQYSDQRPMRRAFDPTTGKPIGR